MNTENIPFYITDEEMKVVLFYLQLTFQYVEKSITTQRLMPEEHLKILKNIVSRLENGLNDFEHKRNA